MGPPLPATATAPRPPQTARCVPTVPTPRISWNRGRAARPVPGAPPVGVMQLTLTRRVTATHLHHPAQFPSPHPRHRQHLARREAPSHVCVMWTAVLTAVRSACAKSDLPEGSRVVVVTLGNSCSARSSIAIARCRTIEAPSQMRTTSLSKG